MSQNNIMFGSDPEFFATYKKDGKDFVLPPVFFRTTLEVPVTPNKTHPIFMDYNGTLIHEDGAAFEMSTAPSYNWTEMWHNIRAAKERFSELILSKFPDYCEADLKSLPTAGWDVERWSKEKSKEFKLSTIFGCDPDHDVYNMQVEPIANAAKHPFRYGGGHIHMSGPEEISESPLLAIRSLVLTAGLAATAFTDTPELDRERVFRYGKPGKFRIQKYKDGTSGVEYRTPSNRWTGNLEMATQVFEWAERGIKDLLIGKMIQDIPDEVEKHAVQAIVNTDQNLAKEVLAYVKERI